MALLLRLAGINRIAAVSNDYPGSLLDHRIPGDPDLHEVERALAVVAALGVEVGHPSALRLRVDVTAAPAVPGRVAVHPGASAPARTLPVSRWIEVTTSLARYGFDVVVTGTPAEAGSCAAVAAPTGRQPVIVPTDDLRRLARELARASVVVAGNTGPTHLAAALGRPVVTVFAPTVPPDRWKPWGVPHVLLGDLDIACAGCRSRICPLRGPALHRRRHGPGRVRRRHGTRRVHPRRTTGGGLDGPAHRDGVRARQPIGTARHRATPVGRTSTWTRWPGSWPARARWSTCSPAATIPPHRR